MSIKVSLGAAVGLMAITAAVTFIITSNVTLDRFNQKIKSVSEKQEFYSKLSEIDTYSRTHYISEIDESKLIEGMVSGYISGIGDSYAEYLTAEQYAQELNEESGVSVGLGFNYEKENGGYIKITRAKYDSKSAMLMHVVNSIGDSIDESSCKAHIYNLHYQNILSPEISKVMLAAIGERCLRDVPPELRDKVRASIFKQLLLANQ